jgi:hypothetical protein
MARIRVNQELNNPIIGKPYLNCAQCLALGSYFFQLGGILGAKHQMNLASGFSALSSASAAAHVG